MPGTKPSDRSVYPDGTPTCAVAVVTTRNYSHDGLVHVHDAECGDRRKAIYRDFDSQQDWNNPIEARDVRDVVDYLYGPEAGSFYTESGWDTDETEAQRNETAWVEYAGEVKVMPCVDLPRDIGGLRHTDEDEVGTATVSVDGVVVAVTKHVDLDEILDSPELAAVLALPEDEPVLLGVLKAAEQVLSDEPDFKVEPILGGSWARITDNVMSTQIDVHRSDIPALIARLATILATPVED
jgi:hypothetical protein